MAGLIESFLRGFGEVEAALTARLEVATLGAALAVILGRARRGDLPRRGDLGPELGYEVHGAGCRFVTADGRVLDLDLDASGAATWDAWRVREFAESIGEGVELSEVEQHLQRALEAGRIMRTRPGWFAARTS